MNDDLEIFLLFIIFIFHTELKENYICYTVIPCYGE